MFTHVNFNHTTSQIEQINENGKRTYLTPEGKKYPSITTVLSEHSKKYILEWRKRVGDEVANTISGKATTRGTALHKACEDYLNNKPVSFKTPDRLELFNSIKPILNRINNIYAQELRMYSDHLRMAGTVDCVAELDGRLCVIDFKSASAAKKKEDIQSYFMQCSAYAVMFEERYGIPISRTAVLIAVEGDSPQLFLEKRDNYIKDLIYYRDLYEKNNGKG